MRRLFTENLSLKLIAFVLSLVLFLVVRGEERSTLAVDVPVLVRVPAGYVVVNDPVDSVSVELQGRWSLLKELRIDELGPISITPTKSTGRTTTTLRAEMISIPPGLEVVGFDPPSVVVALEEKATRTVPVAVDRALTGEPAAGYQQGDVRADPARVQISGALSVVENVSQVFVEPIDISGRSARVVEQRHVVPDRRGIEIEGNPLVDIEIDIVARSRERRLEDVPVHLLDVDVPHELAPKRIDLVLVGEQEAIEDLDPESIFVAFDVSDAQLVPGRSTQIEIAAEHVKNLPTGVAIDSLRAPSVVVYILPEIEDEPPATTLPGAAIPPGTRVAPDGTLVGPDGEPYVPSTQGEAGDTAIAPENAPDEEDTAP